MTTNEWLTPSEAGALLGVGPDRIAQLCREGVLDFMRTPGGHLRVRRDSVENVANQSGSPPEEPDPPPDEVDDTERAQPVQPPQPSRPRWEEVPPWKRRIREAQADFHVLKLEDEKEQMLDARAVRHARREQVEAERMSAEAEVERLKQLKALALSFMPYGVPAAVQAEVARQLEGGVTSERFPAGLSQAHAETLLRADLDRYLRPWRTREARRERVRQEAAKREDMIGWAILKAKLRAPRAWDFETRKSLERDIRQALEEEWHPEMDQDEANQLALDILEQWIEENEDDS